MPERNPNANTFVRPAGFTDLGWQLNWEAPELVRCREAGHKTRSFDNSLFKNRCSDIITICDECKHIHHTDMT